MTETPERVDEPATGPVATLPPPPPPPVYAEPPRDHRPNRLYQAAAWVAIVAGVLFIVGAVFFTGFALGRHSGYDGGWRHHRGDNSQFERRGGPPMMQFPMMPGPGGPGSGPGFAPGGPGGAGATATPAPRP
jgi:hypothetical protein